MKLIDAKWEKRNFGYDVTEVDIDNFDTLDIIKDSIDKIKSKYIAVKVPIGMLDVYKLLSNKGFYFVECLIYCQFNINDIVIEFNNMIKTKSYKAINKDVEVVLKEIKNGNIFNSDRIYLDSNFSKEISGMRYYNWINDLIFDGNVDIVITYFNNELFAFSILKNNGYGEYNCILWGLMPKYYGKGLGKLLVNNTLDFVKKNNGKVLLTTISSNNLAIINCVNKFSFKVATEKYVFVKHL